MKKYILIFSLFLISAHSFGIWSPLGFGLTDRVRALCVHNGELYAGGDFTELVKKWDGISWVSVGGGLTGTTSPKVNTLISFNGELYAGGSFSIAGSQSGNIAKLVGNTWTAVGDGLGGVAGSDVKCFTEFLGSLYAGGTFTQSGSFALSKVAKLNSAGVAWTQVGGGSPPNCSAGVYAITNYYNELYVGGQGSAPWMNKLNAAGTAWLSMSSGGIQMGTGVYALAPFKYPSLVSISLFIGGDFSAPPSPTCCTYYSGSWGTSMNTFSSGTSDQINAFLSTSDYLYAGGIFSVSGPHTAFNIAKKGTSLPWDTVGLTLNGGVHAFAIFNGFLVVGGQFTTANGITVNHVTINDGVFVSQKSPEKPDVICTPYPIPATDRLTFSLDRRDATLKTIEIHDLLGKPVYKNEVSSPELIIDVSILPKGIYIYVLKEDSIEVKTGKIIID